MCDGSGFAGWVTGDPKLRVLRPALQQLAAVSAGEANHLESEVHEFRDYAVAKVAILVRELVGALQVVVVGAEDQQALREVLVHLDLEEVCAVVSAPSCSFDLLLEALVRNHADEVRKVATFIKTPTRPFSA